ncbi:MAG: hypothetical protein QXM00_12480 [Candidatus Bathyarchaeia archaeon]
MSRNSMIQTLPQTLNDVGIKCFVGRSYRCYDVGIFVELNDYISYGPGLQSYCPRK